MRWVSVAYFLPLFLMPCPPVLRGPLPPTLAASSLRAFSSVDMSARCFSLLVDYVVISDIGIYSYRHASSRGKPGRPRRGPCSASWEPSEASPCRLKREKKRVSVMHDHEYSGSAQQPTFSVAAAHVESVSRSRSRSEYGSQRSALSPS